MNLSPLDAPFPDRRLPKQDTDTILLVSDRWDRATRAHNLWAETAKLCVDFMEGRQWSAEDLATLRAEGRPDLTLNKIRPLVNLVVGYHLQNRTDWKFNPGNDDQATFEIAQALNKLGHNVIQNSGVQYVDAEVFLDGLITGRGYYDTRLDFSKNLLGDAKITASDPFSVKLDPDGDTYDINESCSFVLQDRWLSLDEVELVFGKRVTDYVQPWLGATGTSGLPGELFDFEPDVAPWRRFGGEMASAAGQSMESAYERFNGHFDKARKLVRIIDMQHYKNVMTSYFVDLETQDREPIPDAWLRSPEGRMKIEKVLWFGEQNGTPLSIIRSLARRVRWTQVCGDALVYDKWSPYDTFTISAFFPYFRRGYTEGMVQPLIDAQREHNKRRSARLNIIMRAAHGGWKIEKNSMDVMERENLKTNGSRAGGHIFWDSKGGTLPEPKQIEPATNPVGMKQLEIDAEDDLKKISGVNDSSLGQLDRVQSGRAIEARQRQTVVGLESFISNYKRSKRLLGLKFLEVVQDHYTEERAFRILGQDGKPERMIINQITATGVINNITMGKYVCSVDESPASASFMEAQFAEALMLREKGVPIPDDILIELSSLGMKGSIKQRVDMLRAQMGIPPGGMVAPGADPTAATPGGEPAGAVPASPPAAQAAQPAAPLPSPSGQPAPAAPAPIPVPA